MSAPTEDEHKRADRHGRWLYECAVCGRWFRHGRHLASAAGPRVSVCGALVGEAKCLIADDFGNIWWPQDKPMPDLLEIDRRQRELDAARR